ncbi:hypothetical protein LN042_26230 [Kitasatospora sp. RB6PN24]|uniref:hypothetical protein n=1 Tax=Kitasatospora humi TaxID=2893891 RepID=UPI001E513075|nr:hypothetical protein [Kitasatospora humi]MCC9310527.1 hypothetical protein [Kitasatospora humi]
MSSGNSSDERNPFAPPPQDAPEQPWQPRLPQQAGNSGGGRADGDGEDGGEQPDSGPGRPPVPPPHPWSPNWQGGGGPGWPAPPQGPPQPKFDPTDPVHRRARYGLTSGMAALFSGLYGLQELALLFGALALYWGISALRRTGTREPAAGEPGNPTATAPAGWPYAQRSRPQVPAALGGLLTGGVAVALVLGSFLLQLAYRPYYTCVNDALTVQATQSCDNLAPAWLVSATDQQN